MYVSELSELSVNKVTKIKYAQPNSIKDQLRLVLENFPNESIFELSSGIG